MSFFPALLLASILPSGLPLHKGATWTWEITDRSTGSQILRTATAIRSIADDSGTVWTLSVKDSGKTYSDTAKLRVYPDGGQGWKDSSQGWTKYGLKLNWDLESWSRGTPTYFGWGFALWGGLYNGTPSVNAPTANVPLRTVRFSTTPYTWKQREIPTSEWDSAHGLMRHRDGDISWRLLSHDGEALKPASDSLTVPATGSSWSWREQTESESRTLHWEIRTRDDDSLGWVRLSIANHIVRDTGIDSSILSLRLNPATGQRLPARSTASDPDEAWWQRLGDSALVKGTWRGRYSQQYSGATRYGDGTWSSGDYLTSLSSKCLVLQFYFEKDNSTGAFANNSYSKSLTRTLTSINGVAVTPQSLALSPASSPKKSFATLARLHPGTSVRWRDVQGRGGLLPASALISVNGAASRIVFVDATFPDGTTWKGSLLTSTNPGH